MQTGPTGAGQRFDVLIVTAIREEYAAVRAVHTGALPGSTWAARTASTGLEIRVRPFAAAAGGVLWIAVTQALGMGGVEAVSACAQLVAAHRVRCLAMCGVCAGRRGEVALGDVIIADRMWTYDTGKLKAEVDEAGQRVEHERGDMEMYRLAPPAWKHDAERFAVDPAAEWLAARPRSYEAQGDWVLERVLRGGDPATDADSKARCADFEKVLARLWKKKLLRDGAMALTAKGKKHIERVLLSNRGTLPEAAGFRTHVGPMASGSRVVEEAGIFDKLAKVARKVLGLEMEAAAIGGLGWARGIEHVVVMKGVMDHADADKSDNFKAFAAQASAECLLAFVRAHLPVVGEAEDPILERETSPLPPKAGPAALLNARHAVVDFVGREALLGALQGWCEEEGRVAARLIHAAGGMGKTRVAIELCRQMREAGWRVGFVGKSMGVDRFGLLVQSDEPVVAVIDYAESRGQLRELLEVAAARRGEKGKRKLRLVLLARNADEWWGDLRRSEGGVSDLLSEEPVGLAAVDEDREAVFWGAARGFAEARGKRKIPDGVAPSLSDSPYERVLYVHMAALAAVEGWDVKAGALMETTLDHEERFWREQLRDRVAVDDMRQVVAALTLVGGVGSAAEARAMVELNCGAPDKKMALLLGDLYPGGAARHVSGLEPDLLGEAMVWRVLDKEGSDVGAYLDRVFDGATDQALRTGFAVLGRLSEDRKEAEGWIAHMLGHDLAGRAMEAFAAARSVGERTAHAGLGRVLAEALKQDGTVDIARRLEAELPRPDQTVSLLEVGRWVSETLLLHLAEGKDQNRAGLLTYRSVWQSKLGQREAALVSTLEAAALYRRLAKARPDKFLHDLAMSLNNSGLMQNALGQRGAALASTLEAVALYRPLAEARPGTFLAGLAMSLNNLGMMQSELGQREAARASTLDAVTLYRRLAKARPTAFLSNLAASLDNLGKMQSELGQREVALASTMDAVTLYRRLAEGRPDAFQPGLAMSLSNLGNRQSDLGQRDAALASTLEAVALYRRFADARPDAFQPNLATSLSNLGMMQGGLGQREAALASTLEAVTIYRRLADAQPDAFQPGLAMSLNNLGKMQNALGQRETALASALEAVPLYRRLADAQPDAFQPGLATSLNNLGNMQRSLGQREAALASGLEAVTLRRRLVASHPEAFVPDLAGSLSNLALTLHGSGRFAEALSHAEDALDLLWPVYERFPDAHGDLAGYVLHTMATLLKALGQPPDKRMNQRMARYLALSGS